MKTAVLVETNGWNEHPAEHVSLKKSGNVKLSGVHVKNVVSFLKSAGKENVFDELNDCKNFVPSFRTMGLNPEIYSVQVEFCDSHYVLYEKFINQSSLVYEQGVIKQFNKYINSYRCNKLLFPNFRYVIRDFCIFYEKCCGRNNVKNICNSPPERAVNLNVINTDFICIDSEFILSFGIYLYWHRILKFSRERSFNKSRYLLKYADSWQKRNILKILIKMFDLCAGYNINIKTISSFKNYVQNCMLKEVLKVGDNSLPHCNYQVTVDKNEITLELKNKVDENNAGTESRSNVNYMVGNVSSFESYPEEKTCFNFYKPSTSLQNIFGETSLNTAIKINLKTGSPVLHTVSTGKEELDVIDGVNIYSFETEPDMMDFTMVQTKQFSSQDNDLLDSVKIPSSGRILPTKTRDITKIKGWRNKLFCISKNDKDYLNFQKNLCVNFVKSNQLDSLKSVKPKIKEEIIENDNQNLKATIDLYPEVKLNEEQMNVTVKEEPVDIHIENISSSIQCENNSINHVNENDGTYSHLFSEQQYLQNLSLEVKDHEKNDGIFQSDTLDKYLDEHSKLNITFELPKPYFSKLPDDNIKHAVMPIKIEKPKDVKNEEKLKELLSEDFIQNMQGDISDRKFIWVRGRPIMIDHESKKTSANSSSKKRPLSNSYESCEDDIDTDSKENDSKKIKVTKQLEYSDTADEGSSELTVITDKTERPYLKLLNTFKIDEKDETCNADSDRESKQRFPLAFPCLDNNHFECSKFTKIQLAMLLNIGYKRPFSSEVLKNVENLRKDVATVDDMWAHIAASAVCPKNAVRTVKRYIVPVVTDSLIEVVKFNLENVSANVSKINELNVQSVYKSICDSNTIKHAIPDAIELEVKNVVEDMLNYVANRHEYESSTIPYDPDVPVTKSDTKPPVKRAKKSKVERELQRLINVSLVDDWNQSSPSHLEIGSCTKEYCLKGCICNSLNGKLRILHCGKVECMFSCSCVLQKDYSIIQRGRNRTLAKDESSWHQTVICKNNEVIEVKAGAGKAKREKKLPTRYRNNVLLGKEMNCLDYFPSSPEPPKKQIIPNKGPSSSKDKDKDVKMKCKEAKGKGKDKEMKIKCKEAKPKEKDKESKISEKEIKSKESDDDIKNYNKKEAKTSEKWVDTESKRENESKTPIKPLNISDSKVTTPYIVKKVASKPKSVISTNLKPMLNQSDLDKIAKICQEEETHCLTLADVFIWCSLHYGYNCSCSAQVFSSKTNRWVWKPSAYRTHLTSKNMSQIMIDKPMHKHHVFDRSSHSARTYGTVFNYKLRNSNPVYKSKRLNEVINNVLSSTNSFMKIQYFGLKAQLPKVALQTSEESDPIKPVVPMSKNVVRFRQNILVNRSLSTENKKRKRPSNEPTTYIIANSKGDVVFQNSAKKKYRIGPAHFNCMGNYRPIVSSNIPSKNILKSKTNGHGVFEQNYISPFNVGSDAKDNEIKTLPKYGLLCLTQGFGYLPVKEYTPRKLQVQDPLSDNVYHCFKDIDSANKWLNRFFKNRIIFESLNVNLKWVIVKPGILKQSQQFDKSLLDNPTKIVNKDGLLVDINKINRSSNAVSSSSENHQPNKIKRSSDIAIDLEQDVIEMPPKKPKISCDTPKLRQILPQPNGLSKTNLVNASTGILHKVAQDHFPIKKNVTALKLSNRPAFFRLNNSHDSSGAEGFIPIIPSTTSGKPYHSPTINGVKLRESNTVVVNNLSCKGSPSSAAEQRNSSLEKVIVARVGKTVPLNIKPLPGKSLLKTKYK